MKTILFITSVALFCFGLSAQNRNEITQGNYSGIQKVEVQNTNATYSVQNVQPVYQMSAGNQSVNTSYSNVNSYTGSQSSSFNKIRVRPEQVNSQYVNGLANTDYNRMPDNKGPLLKRFIHLKTLENKIKMPVLTQAQKRILNYRLIAVSNQQIHDNILPEKFDLQDYLNQKTAPVAALPQQFVPVRSGYKIVNVNNNTGLIAFSGFGVYIASFRNKTYCDNIAYYLQKKYKVIPYIVQEYGNSFRFHLVMGRWISFSTAKIYLAKFRHEIPKSIIIRWSFDKDCFDNYIKWTTYTIN